MPNIQTATEIGAAIRARRRALGWDQAHLAHQAGVTRQWVIDIEKGKPRAELGLVLRTLNVLGLTVMIETRSSDQASARQDAAQTRPAGGRASAADIDAIVERHRGPDRPPDDAMLVPYLRRESRADADAVAVSRVAEAATPVPASSAIDYLVLLDTTRRPMAATLPTVSPADRPEASTPRRASVASPTASSDAQASRQRAKDAPSRQDRARAESDSSPAATRTRTAGRNNDATTLVGKTDPGTRSPQRPGKRGR